MKIRNPFLKIILLFLLFIISSCNKNKTTTIDNKPADSPKISQINNTKKTLVFDIDSKINKTAYELVFEGNSVLVTEFSFNGAAEFTQRYEFNNGKIQCDNVLLELTDNSLEDEDGFHPFNRSKSTISIDEILNPNKGKEFQGQTLKAGEKIIKINWGKENKINYTSDMTYNGPRYASNILIVPNGKKWILLYLNEDITYESGNVIGAVPDLFIDNIEAEIHNRRFSNPNNINLSKAKDENFKYYSGSKIKAISSRNDGKGVGDNFIDYKGELWFLEIND